MSLAAAMKDPLNGMFWASDAAAFPYRLFCPFPLCWNFGKDGGKYAL